MPAVNLGKLKELAKDANLKSMKKQLFLMLRNEKVGTTKVEFKAMNMLEEGQCAKNRAARVLKREGIPIKERIICHREETLVMGLISLKLEQCEREEREAKDQYRRVKNKLWKMATTESQKRRHRRHVKKILEMTKKHWDKNKKKFTERVRRLVEKYKKGRVKNEEEEWIEEVANASGDKRERIRVHVPIVGEIDFDCDEMSALSLPPEFAVYEKVCHEEILLQKKHVRQR